MTERRSIFRQMQIFARIVAALCLLPVILAATGCQSVNVEEADAAIRQELDALIAYDESSTNPLLRAIREGFDVEVLSVESSDDKSFSAKCVLSNHDVAGAFAVVESVEPGTTLIGFAQAISLAFSEQPRLEYETELAIELLDDGTCRAVFTEVQLDAATGGLLSLYNQMAGGAA